ncbi:hypothetical protein L195_g036916 [Trifolium pratense]|uniref:Uncharacterized protein n=1 Tax=Trifolium pratense TaxID=57577 RepID=A0A2K3LQW1_TRIPR|nr:hypothetical protein L195_g036916 [Trifolium pratense]
MIRRLRWFVGLNQKNCPTKRLVNADQPGLVRPNHLPMIDAVHEVAIYIHRFHNLDLFEQGWYKIKVTMRLVVGEDSYPGIPARVVQYEVRVDLDLVTMLSSVLLNSGYSSAYLMCYRWRKSKNTPYGTAISAIKCCGTAILHKLVMAVVEKSATAIRHG